MDKKIILLLFSFLLAPGCTRTEKLSSDVYKIAVAAPQFGPYQELGLSIIRGAELAVDLKNKDGGINGKKIELVKVDDGGLAGEGTWRAKSLVSEMVLGVIGHLNSDISIPASEIYSRAMISEITPGSTSPFFTERESVRGYVFRTIGRDDAQGKVAADFVRNGALKKIAVLYNNRGYGASLASEFVKQLNDKEIVFYEMYKVDTKNYLKEISNLKTKSPDVVFFVGEYGDAARFLKELRNSGLKTTFLGSEGIFDEAFINSAKGACEGALVISLPEIKDLNFITSYKNKFSRELGAYSANSFDAANILISAIEKVKEKNPDKVAQAIKETKDYSGLTGNITFDRKGDLVNPNFSIYQVKDGMFVAIK